MRTRSTRLSQPRSPLCARVADPPGLVAPSRSGDATIALPATTMHSSPVAHLGERRDPSADRAPGVTNARSPGVRRFARRRIRGIGEQRRVGPEAIAGGLPGVVKPGAVRGGYVRSTRGASRRRLGLRRAGEEVTHRPRSRCPGRSDREDRRRRGSPLSSPRYRRPCDESRPRPAGWAQPRATPRRLAGHHPSACRHFPH